MGKIASLAGSNPSTLPIDQSSAIFVWLLFGITDLISFILNLFTLIVIFKCKTRLKGYLISLTLSDLLTAPAEHSLNNKTTAMTVCCISIHRYFVIAHGEKKFKSWNCNYISIVIWVLGVIFSIPTAMMYKKIDGTCRSDWSRESLFYYRLTVKILFIGAPVVIMTSATLGTIFKLWRHGKVQTDDQQTDRKLASNKLSAERSITIALASYLLCEVPSSMITLGSMMKPSRFYNQDACSTVGCQIIQARFIIADWLPLAQSLLNPIIYYMMCKNFRTDLRRVMSGLSGSKTGTSSKKILDNSQASSKTTKTTSSDGSKSFRWFERLSSITSLSFWSNNNRKRNLTDQALYIGAHGTLSKKPDVIMV